MRRGIHRFWLEPCWVAQIRVTVAGVKSGMLSSVSLSHPKFPGHCLPLALLTLGLERHGRSSVGAQSSDSIAPRFSRTLVGHLILFLASSTVGIMEYGHCVGSVGFGVGLPRCNLWGLWVTTCRARLPLGSFTSHFITVANLKL